MPNEKEAEANDKEIILDNMNLGESSSFGIT